ncbi:MAG: hypothetical protein V9G04_06640 [Nocardioides sp.]
MSTLRGVAAIAGIGATEFSKDSGRSSFNSVPRPRCMPSPMPGSLPRTSTG